MVQHSLIYLSHDEARDAATAEIIHARTSDYRSAISASCARRLSAKLIFVLESVEQIVRRSLNLTVHRASRTPLRSDKTYYCEDAEF